MVLGNEVEQYGGFFFHTGVEVHATKSLIDLPDGALERLILLIAEERGISKLLFQYIDFFHGVLVGGMKGLLARRLADAQPLIVIVVKGVECVCVVNDNLEECIALIGCRHRLLLQGTAQHLHQLPKLGDLLLAYTFVHGIALDEILLQHAVCPLAEAYTSLAMHAIPLPIL